MSQGAWTRWEQELDGRSPGVLGISPGVTPLGPGV